MEGLIGLDIGERRGTKQIFYVLCFYVFCLCAETVDLNGWSTFYMDNQKSDNEQDLEGWGKSDDSTAAGAIFLF